MKLCSQFPDEMNFEDTVEYYVADFPYNQI